ncbi:MAG: HAD family hydrolase [Eubacterium sp.]
MLETLRRLQEKGIGVNKVLEYYGIDKSQAMAFGDGNNDIEMFEQVGHPIAMGNASDDLKSYIRADLRSCCGRWNLLFL